MTVSFNKQQERIKVPFAALSAFVDPSVRFGLQFDRKDKAAGGRQGRDVRRRPTAPDAAAGARKAPAARRAGRRRGQAGGRRRGRRREAKPEDAASKIVKLDSFRKK